MASDVSGVSGPKKDHALYAQQILVDAGLDKEWEVVIADNRTLQVDLDTPVPDWADFHRVKNILDEMLSEEIGHRVVTPYKSTISKGGNVHVQITLPINLNAEARVAWQAALGSDPVREALHMVSLVRQEANPILFFERREVKQLTGGIDEVIV
jgi:hypothetical protein